MVGPFGLKDRVFGVAAGVGAGAAGGEVAAGGKGMERWDNAGDFGEALVWSGLAGAGDRGEQALHVGVLGGCEEGVDVGLFNFAAGIHDDDAVRGLGDHTEIVGDEQHRGAGFLLQFKD